MYRVGKPTEALAEFERALTRSPKATDALIGKLRVYADYHLKGGIEVARATLTNPANKPKIIVAAADVLYANGLYDEAIETLDRAWTESPGDRVLRRARLQWALSVDIAPTED